MAPLPQAKYLQGCQALAYVGSGTRTWADGVACAWGAEQHTSLLRRCVQALERDQSSSWVRRVEVGGKQGREFHRRGLTLLQVVLHTGRQVGQ